jgi:hypothetical protein
MGEQSVISTDTPRRVISGNIIKLALAIFFYVVALPFELLMVWSALQVIFISAGHVTITAALAHVAAVTLARAHPIPFGIIAVASLAAAFIGAALHQNYHRA